MVRADDSADVVVIGCGVAGAWTALFLAAGGVRRLTVVDQSYPGSGASTRGTGLVRVHHANRFETHLAYLSRRYYKDWESSVGMGSCGWRETGVMWIVSPQNVERLHENVAAQSEIGCETRVLTPEEIVALQPHIDADGIGAAAFEPDSGTAIGTMAIDGLVSRLVADGVQVRSHTPVRGLIRDKHGVTGVATDAGTIRTDRVVLAAGAWSATLARTVGVEVPLTATRATLGTAYYPTALEPVIAFFDEVLDCSFAPKSGGSWTIVPVRDADFLTPVDPDRTPPPHQGAADAGLELISRRIPALRARGVLGARWAAADGVTPDGRPLIGEHPDLPGLFLHAGGNFKGFKMAPVGARGLVAQMLGQSDPDVDVTPYGIGRFGSNRAAPWLEGGYVGSRWT